MYAYAQAGGAPTAHHYAPPPPPPTYIPQFAGDPSGALGAAAAISQHHLNQHSAVAAAHLGGLHHMTEPQLTELTSQSKRRR